MDDKWQNVTEPEAAKSRSASWDLVALGWHVEYLLTHSNFPFAAALAADNVDYGYVQYLSWDPLSQRDFERLNGAVPTGSGLQKVA